MKNKLEKLNLFLNKTTVKVLDKSSYSPMGGGKPLKASDCYVASCFDIKAR